MGNQEYYEMKLEVIKAIEDDKIETPHNIPVGIYAHEADCLYGYARDDKDALAAVGLPPMKMIHETHEKHKKKLKAFIEGDFQEKIFFLCSN